MSQLGIKWASLYRIPFASNAPMLGLIYLATIYRYLVAKSFNRWLPVFVTFALYATQATGQTCAVNPTQVGLTRGQIYFRDHMPEMCYRNSFRVLQILSARPDFSIDEAKVLYITDFANYNFHVMIEYRGMILDANQRYFYDDDVPLVPIAQYFAEHQKSSSSEMRVIPASEYLAEYESLKSTYYTNGLRGFEHNVDELQAVLVEARYPAQKLSTYLCRTIVSPRRTP